MRRKATVPAYARGPNLALAEAMRGKAGALTHGDRRTRRARTRSERRRRAIEEQRP